MKIRIHYTGTETSTGQRTGMCVDMVAKPEETLVSIIDRVPSPLVEVRVKAIEILN